MEWADVGGWLEKNAGTGAALVGSLLVGNVPGAVAAGVSLVASATGHATPDAAMAALQGNPDALIKLKELANANDADIRAHIAKMTELDLQNKQAELADAQAEQKQTQDTIRSGDNAEDKFVKRTRPGQAWLSLAAGIVYAFLNHNPDIAVLGMLFTLPFTYAGLRTVQHWNETKVAVAKAVADGTGGQ